MVKTSQVRDNSNANDNLQSTNSILPTNNIIEMVAKVSSDVDAKVGDNVANIEELMMNSLLTTFQPPDNHQEFSSDETFKQFFMNQRDLMIYIMKKYVSNDEITAYRV